MRNSSCGSGEKQIGTCLEVSQRRPHCLKKSASKRHKSCTPVFHNGSQALVIASRHRIGHPYSAPETVNAAVALTRSTFPYLCVFGCLFKAGFLQLIFYSFFIMLIIARETSSPQALKSFIYCKVFL